MQSRRKTIPAACLRIPRLLGALILGLALAGCSIKRIAVNQLGNALASGGSVYSSDDDPELIRAALPFSLKLIESLLAESPEHTGLLMAATSGFTQFSYAFVQVDAEKVELEDVEAADVIRNRARRLYLRARDYGLRGMDVNHPGFAAQLRDNPTETVSAAEREDVAWLYWLAASWGAAISISKDNPQLISEQVIVEALIDRALQLDEAFDQGAIHSFLISYEMVRQGAEGDPAARAQRHFERAIALSKGKLAGPYVTYAESVMIQKQDAKTFQSLLEKALAIDADAVPQSRLMNLIMQNRAKWLLSRLDELFLMTNNP